MAEAVKTSIYSITRKFAYPHWRWYLGGIVALCVTNLIALEIPQLSKDIVNNLSETAKFGHLENLALAIIGLGFLQMLIRAISRILIFWPGRQLEAEVKNDYFQRFFTLPHSFFEHFGMGDLISRLSNDVGQLRVFYAFAVLQIVNLLALSVFTISKMLTIHPQLTFLCLAPLALMVLITRYAVPRFHLYSRRSQETLGHLTNKVTEAFVNVITIKNNTAEDQFSERISEEIEHVYKANIKLIAIRTLIFPAMVLLTGFSFLIVLFYGGREVIEGRLTIGDIMAFNIYIGMLSFPLTAVGIVIAIYQRARTAVDRLAELDQAEPEKIHLDLDRPSLKDSKPALLKVSHLKFRYPSDSEEGKSNERKLALHDISFEVFAGQKVGITGPVGSGKSTLFQLITRLYDPEPGMIFWHGKDILSLDPRHLRQQIGYAQQSVHLFSDHIRNNLAFGTGLEDDQAKLDEAARQACVLNDIEQFPDAWLTEIGEKGVRLSGGQKQRLSLARIFLRHPELFILDDTTSAVDQSTEQAMINNIIATKRTVILSSHRSSALRHCDLIIVMRDGQIDCMGPYEKMLGCGDLNFLVD